MHFYWRILEELKYLGETWTLRDPSLSRCFRTWVGRHARAISWSDREEETGNMESPVFTYKGFVHSLN